MTSPPIPRSRLVAGRVGATLLALYLLAVALRIDGCYGPEPSLRDARPDAGPPIGAAFPAFSMRDLSGAEIGLGDLAGKPAVLAFVPSLDWSAPSKARVIDLAQALEGHDDVTVAVIMTAAQATGRARAFVRDRATPCYYLIDEHGLTADLGLATPAPDGTAAATPATFVLDRTGVVRARDVRVRSETWPAPATLLDALARLG